MKFDFSTISLYVDENETLIGIPCGESEKYGIADIDTVLLLKAPYSAKQVEVSTIEKYTKKKGFVNATADLTLISLVKTKEAYSIMPTFNDYEKGPLCIDDDERIVPLQYNEGELYEHIHDIIMVYMKANTFYKEQQIAEENRKKKQGENLN